MLTVTVFIEGKNILRDGYTRDGKYYGTPGRVYEFYSPDVPAISGAVRARTLTQAKKLIEDAFLNRTYWFKDKQEYFKVDNFIFEK